MFSHNQIIACLQVLFPALQHGKDFVVAHPIDLKTGEQTGEAFIAAWYAKDVQPEIEAVRAKWDEAKVAFEDHLKARGAL